MWRRCAEGIGRPTCGESRFKREQNPARERVESTREITKAIACAAPPSGGILTAARGRREGRYTDRTRCSTTSGDQHIKARPKVEKKKAGSPARYALLTRAVGLFEPAGEIATAPDGAGEAHAEVLAELGTEAANREAAAEQVV